MASHSLSVVSAIEVRFPAGGLAERECDGNALKALLREPPCETCKKDQAGIKLQYY